MNDLQRMTYLGTIILQSPGTPKARNVVFALNCIYESVVGYQPMQDDPSMTPKELAELAIDYAEISEEIA